MSIERHNGAYIPTCDFCGAELAEEYDFYDAVETKKVAGWKAQKINGCWEDVCPDCQAEMDFSDG